MRPAYHVTAKLTSSPPLLEVEIDSPDANLVLCDSRIIEVEGFELRRWDERCQVLAPKSERCRIKYSLGFPEGLTAPPAKALLPVRVEDPYKPFNLYVAVEAPPSFKVLGLPNARSRAITSVKYVYCEGVAVPQLLAFRGTCAERELCLPRCALYTHPLECGDEVIDAAKLEELHRGGGLLSWAEGLRRAARRFGTWSSIKRLALEGLALAQGLDRIRRIFTVARSMAATASYAGYASPLTFAKALLEAEVLSAKDLVRLTRVSSEELRIATAIPLRLRIRGVREGQAMALDTLVKENLKLRVPGCAWHAISFLCDECWEPLA